jgi:GMP synthase (glutamine-hydrolysing)
LASRYNRPVLRILLYKTGATDPSLTSDIGDYEQWFGRILSSTAHLEVHCAIEEPRHPLGGYDAMVITGSPRSLVDPEPWMDEAADYVRTAASAGVPVLGVCFGHQLIGYAYGGCVRTNPNGWEVGTTEVELTEEGRADPLFAGVPPRVRVNQSHRDEVWTLGNEVRRLAGSVHTATQALAVGAHVRGVQFHPEMNATVVRRLVEHRRLILEADFAQRAGRCLSTVITSVSDTPEAEKVLTNFIEHFVRAA